ncbi:helix-turn-helix domain-containing protein [Dictyobacter arantiisoli]|uniref:HTH cro/C1-type domain-containing protein n=1 Tax=Dictyobacter arantiisoli TaxID=2014874 RepID=A0A5A5TI11_9CHLR|nr:helix-turn-helix domain-containing protein [Dictyobacter arantiisoli]GCF11230.1 hypothetical protein KDI_47940 [Dictyobacter arantiisoli]
MNNHLLTMTRKQQGWRQEDVANHIGVARGTISRWERGRMHPERYHVDRLCAFLHATETELGFTPERAVATPATIKDSAPAPVVDAQPSMVIDPMIPLQQAPLIGREAELAQIHDLLQAEETVKITALHGLPGVGKTALATTVARDANIRARYSDGILWATLGPHPDLLTLFHRWATLLDMPDHQMTELQTVAEWNTALTMMIGQRAMLVVIDDAWTVEDALAVQVGGPHCAHLLTTRFPHIASRITIQGALTIQELSDDHSMQLLTHLAPAVMAREPEQMQHLVQAVGGLPLALTLMGHALRTAFYHGPTRRLQAAIDALQTADHRLQLSHPDNSTQGHPSLLPETPLSLQAILDVTTQRLSESALHTLAVFSLFPAKPDSFSEEAALSVAGCTIDDLDELLDTGLLETVGDERYRLHRIITDYAHHLLMSLQHYEHADRHKDPLPVQVHTMDQETHDRTNSHADLEDLGHRFPNGARVRRNIDQQVWKSQHLENPALGRPISYQARHRKEKRSCVLTQTSVVHHQKRDAKRRPRKPYVFRAGRNGPALCTSPPSSEGSRWQSRQNPIRPIRLNEHERNVL